MDEFSIVPKLRTTYAEHGAGHFHTAWTLAGSMACYRDDVAQVRDRLLTKGTLGAFDEQVVLLQHGDDGVDTLTEDEDVIEEDKDEASEVWLQDIIHQGVER